MGETPHELVNPPGMPPPVGYAHVVVPSEGRTIHIAGQTGHGPDGVLPEGIVEQFDGACANVVSALRAAGGEPEHLASMQIFVTDVEGYAAASKEIGEAYRRHFGRHYPAMALLGVTRLLDPAAMVELVAVAVVPPPPSPRDDPARVPDREKNR